MGNPSAGISERQGSLEVDHEPITCVLCGRPTRYRGRRARVQIYECTDERCMITVFEVCDAAPAHRPGGRSWA